MKNTQRGVAIVEFALIVPLLILLSVITTEYGRALYQYNTLTKAVRDGARYLAMQTPPLSGSLTPEEETMVNRAKNLVVYGSFSNSGAPLAVGLNPSQVPDPQWQLQGAAPVINTVTIKVAGCATSPPPCYSFAPIFTGAFGVNFGIVNFADISATMRAPL